MVSKKGKKFNMILTVFLLVLSLFFLFPIVWMVMNSFKSEAAIAQSIYSAEAA